MDRLPPELLFYILEFISDKDLVFLQTVCRRLLPIARANQVWRGRCYDKSPAIKVRAWTNFTEILSRPPPAANTANEAAATFASMLQMADAGSSSTDSPSNRRQWRTETPRDQRLRAVADWDPSYEHERVDWYSEYVARCGPLSVSWFQTAGEEIKGMAYWQYLGKQAAVGLLEDGTLCMWDTESGQEIGRSDQGLLCQPESLHSRLSGPVEVSVDSTSGKAFVASDNILHVVDLSTMKVTATYDFTFPITALSQSSSACDFPLTVGTKYSVHTFDIREGTVNPTLESNSANPPSPSLAAGDTYPLSILNATPNSIYLAGRYPSILAYDRRFFPRLENTIYSGARLCSLGLSNFTPPASASSASVVSTLLAVGEYNGRGSLETYSLPYEKDLSHVYKNRQTASRSKLLSVASHGTRIVFSDADGGLKWVERDGTSLVRSWNINQFTFMESRSQQQSRGSRTVLEFGAQGGDVVRKIINIPAGPTERGFKGDEELLLWTGEKGGVLRFKDQEVWEDAKEMVEDEKGVAASEVEGREARQQREMEEAMRRALMRHADEMNWMRRLGLA